MLLEKIYPQVNRSKPFNSDVTYRSPGPYSSFLDEFGALLSDLKTHSDNILVVGDFLVIFIKIKRCLITRWGKLKVAANRQKRVATGGGQSTAEDLTPAEDMAASMLTKESVEGFGGLQVGIQDNNHCGVYEH